MAEPKAIDVKAALAQLARDQAGLDSAMAARRAQIAAALGQIIPADWRDDPLQARLQLLSAAALAEFLEALADIDPHIDPLPDGC
jgi:hypothetical protein